MSNNFQVLSPSESIFEKRLLEASAGTGKTFSIEHIVVRLLIESEEPLTIAQIIIVTFTKAATRELKIRIRLAISKALAILSGETRESAPPYLLAILDQGKVAQKRELLETALLEFDQAQISTIHSFCYEALSLFAFESSVSLEMKDPNEVDMDGVMHESLQDFFRTRFTSEQFLPSEAGHLLAHFRGEWGRLMSKICSFASSTIPFPKHLSAPEALNRFNALLRSGVFPSPDQYVAAFEKELPLYKGIKVEELEKEFLIFKEVLIQGFCTFEQLDGLIQNGAHLFCKFSHENRKVRAKFDHDPILESIGLQVSPLLSSLIDGELIALRIAALFQLEWKQKTEELSLFSPDILLEKMAHACKNPRFVEKVRSHYLGAIIDEFQDTDPIQWEIFSRLFFTSPKTRAFYLVGDPKQSIYAFRGADLGTYLTAVDEMGADKKRYLDTNYRSQIELINALNYLFDESAGRWLDPSGGVAYHPVLPSPYQTKTKIPDGKGSVCFGLYPAKPGREKSWPSVAIETDVLFPWMAHEIHALQEIPRSQIVVLVRDRYQAKRVFDYFQSVGIHSRLHRLGGITETKGYELFQEALAAHVNPEDESALNRFLIGPLCGLDPRSLMDPTSKTYLSVMEKVFGLSLIWKERGFGAFFQSLLNTNFLGETVAEKLLARHHLGLYFEVLQAGEVCMERVCETQTSPDALVSYLKLKQQKAAEEGIFTAEAPSIGSAVVIMTTHVSKGLEFDVVFALGLASRDKEISPHSEEKMRQLYVGWTRAARRLYIPLVIDDTADAQKASPNELFFSRRASTNTFVEYLSFLEEAQKKYDLSFEMLRGSEASTDVQEKEDVVLYPPILPSKNFISKEVISFTSMARKIESKKEEVLAFYEQLEDQIPQGAETGTLLHAIFETIFSGDLHRERDATRRKEVIAKAIWGTPLCAWGEEIEKLIERTLDIRMGDNGQFCLRDIPSHKMHQELPFFFDGEEVLVKGFIDLFFEKDGKYYIIDWKSNVLKATEDAMNDAMEKHQYRLQGDLYAVAVEKYLAMFGIDFFAHFGGIYYVFLRRGEYVSHFPQTSTVTMHLVRSEYV